MFNMSLNSSFTNTSSYQSLHLVCDSMSSSLANLAFNISRAILLLPLSVFILYMGFEEWRQQRSFKAASHFDIFTYHQALMEMIWGLGIVFNALGLYFHCPPIKGAGKLFSRMTFFGETIFHILTCVERYLAVVYPVTYRGLQNSHGATIRNVSIILTWLVTCLWAYIFTLHPEATVFPFLAFLVLSFTVISLCSFFVLRALIHRGPGEGDKNKGQVHQLKQKAFYTVTAIFGVVFTWFSAYLVVTAIVEAKLLTQNAGCVISVHIMWFSIPSSLILPLIYLHKKGFLF